MAADLIFLGTSSMVATRDRNVQSIVVQYKGRLLVVDCGEGTLRQMGIAGLSPARITTILLTHWHWDHVGGLVGIIQAFAASHPQRELTIYGPAGTRVRVARLREAIEDRANWGLNVQELEPQPGEVAVFAATEDYALQCASMSHGCPTLGYAFQEQDRYQMDREEIAKLGLGDGPLIGKLLRAGEIEIDGHLVRREECCRRMPGSRLAIVPDTAPNDAISKLAAGADLMVCESTYGTVHEEQAIAHHHMTAKQAAQFASQGGAKRLVLTHFSQRYHDVTELLEEARAVFPVVEGATDFLRIHFSKR